MNEPELIRQVIQGGGNMPAYGNNLTPNEVKASGILLGFSPPTSHDPSSKSVPPGKGRACFIERTRQEEAKAGE